MINGKQILLNFYKVTLLGVLLISMPVIFINIIILVLMTIINIFPTLSRVGISLKIFPILWSHLDGE